MNNDRLNFRAWNKVTLTDDEDNDYEKSFMLYNVDPFKGHIAGINKEDFEDQLKKKGFSEDEIEQIEQNYNRTCDDYLNIDVNEIEQCTGLRDKNGKLIYEGDILLVTNVMGEFKVCVEHCDEEASYYCRDYDGDTLTILVAYADKSKVIGNIHQNLELLK